MAPSKAKRISMAVSADELTHSDGNAGCPPNHPQAAATRASAH